MTFIFFPWNIEDFVELLAAVSAAGTIMTELDRFKVVVLFGQNETLHLSNIDLVGVA